MPKLPAIGTILTEAFNTFKRFPGVLLFAVAGAIALSYYIDFRNNEECVWLMYLIFTCSLGAVLFFNMYLFFERNKIGLKEKWLYSILVLVALAVYYFLQPEELNRISVVRFFLFNLGLHLLVSFVAFINFDEPNGFWHFNQRLFIRVFISLLYSLVLFAGTALALSTIDYLFTIDIYEDSYLRAFYFIFIVFNSWIFLNGVPKRLHELEQDESFPRLLKFFSQFVLLPLVTVYIVILYIYIIRLFVIGQGPDTNVAYMVLALAIAGMLALLFVWPMQNLKKYKWLRIYQESFYIILIPLIILFFVAIWHRVRDFGITENRYFVLVLALWLFGIAVYFIFSRKKNIMLIPITLCVIVFLSSFGPWGAIKFSRVSQLMRFETILNNNNLLRNGKAIAIEGKMDKEQALQLNSVTTYIVDVFGIKKLQPYFELNLDSISETEAYKERQRAGVVMDLLNVDVPIIQYDLNREDYIFYSIQNNDAYDITGYNKLLKISTNKSERLYPISSIDDEKFSVEIRLVPTRLVIYVDEILDVEMELESHLINWTIKGDSNETENRIIFEREGEKYKYKFYLDHLEADRENDKILDVYNTRGNLFIGQK